MKVFRVVRKQVLPISLEEAWSFFSRPENLVKITPPHMGFRIQYKSGDEMYAGQIITYKLHAIPLITTTWVTEITQVRPPHYFVDEQRSGPYKMWHHQHKFSPVKDGTEIYDEVNYAIPFGIFGRIANSVFVAGEVGRIFDYRMKVLTELFDQPIHQLKVS